MNFDVVNQLGVPKVRLLFWKNKLCVNN